MSTTTQDAFGIKILNSRDARVRQLRKSHPSSLHGNKIWTASYLLMDYFQQNPVDKNTQLMEIGCGWGLAGLYLNKQYSCPVKAVDADADVFPYLKLHAEINDCAMPDTEAKRFEAMTSEDFSGIDLLIAADVCFWDDLTQV